MRLNDATNVMCLTLSLFPFSPYPWRFFSTGHPPLLDDNRSPNTPAVAGNSASQFPADKCKFNQIRGHGETSFQCKSPAISSHHIPETQLAKPTPLRFWNTGLVWNTFPWPRWTKADSMSESKEHCEPYLNKENTQWGDLTKMLPLRTWQPYISNNKR